MTTLRNRLGWEMVEWISQPLLLSESHMSPFFTSCKSGCIQKVTLVVSSGETYCWGKSCVSINEPLHRCTDHQTKWRVTVLAFKSLFGTEPLSSIEEHQQHLLAILHLNVSQTPCIVTCFRKWVLEEDQEPVSWYPKEPLCIITRNVCHYFSCNIKSWSIEHRESDLTLKISLKNMK